MGNTATLTVSELLDLGDKYLLDMNYEQALAQFLEVIEIEQKEPRGYTGAADAYIGLGNLDNAISILERGLRVLPENADIQVMLDELQSPIIGVVPTPEPAPELTPEPIPMPTPESTLDLPEDANIEWQQLYIDLINENIGPSISSLDSGWAQYALLYINNDVIPELIIERDPHYEYANAERSTLYTIYEGEIQWSDNIHLYHHNYLSHIERENLFKISGAHMGAGGDEIYIIENGLFILTHSGGFWGVGLPSDMGPEEYFWDGVEVSASEYDRLLEQAFNSSRVSNISYYNYNEIIALIESMRGG